jgi:hypothetical protein
MSACNHRDSNPSVKVHFRRILVFSKFLTHLSFSFFKEPLAVLYARNGMFSAFPEHSASIIITTSVSVATIQQP